jgi:hypothetical protein
MRLIGNVSTDIVLQNETSLAIYNSSFGIFSELSPLLQKRGLNLPNGLLHLLMLCYTGKRG